MVEPERWDGCRPQMARSISADLAAGVLSAMCMDVMAHGLAVFVEE